MQTLQSEQDHKMIQHLQATYGNEWPERMLLSSYHLTYYVLNSKRTHVDGDNTLSDSLPPEVMEGLDMLYAVVYGLYDGE